MRCLTLLVVSAAIGSVDAGSEGELLWRLWKREHGRVYSSGAVDAERFAVFEENRRFINEHNARGDSSVVLGTNQFSDLSFDEWRAKYLGRLRTERGGERRTAVSDPAPRLPDAVDWVRRNGTTPVKNQGPCGGCWAFSATGALEGMEFVASGADPSHGPPSLSEQELLACTVNKKYSEGGCGGGTMSSAFKFAQANGLCAEEAMPFTAWNTTLTNKSCTGTVGGTVPTCTPALAPGSVGSVALVASSESGLAAAVVIQPVSIGIEADHPEFQHYKGGVFKDMGCGTKLDHGVLLVGYGQEGNQTCDPTTPGSRVCSTTETCCKDAPGGDHVWGCCPMEDAKCCAAPKPGDQQNCCPSNMVCYNCPGKNCECVTSAELRRLEFEAKMQGKATEQLPPVGRPAVAVRKKDHGPAVAACTPEASVKTGVCMGGDTTKIPGSDKGQMLPTDCAKLCEADSSCLGWSVVPSTVPAGLRQWQGCYTSNTTWDGGRVVCPYAGDSSGCSSRGAAKCEPSFLFAFFCFACLVGFLLTKTRRPDGVLPRWADGHEEVLVCQELVGPKLGSGGLHQVSRTSTRSGLHLPVRSDLIVRQDHEGHGRPRTLWDRDGWHVPSPQRGKRAALQPQSQPARALPRGQTVPGKRRLPEVSE